MGMDSHSVALSAHEFSTVAASVEIRILVCLRSLLSSSHLALIEGVAGCNGILVSGHGDTHFALVE